MNPGEIGMPGCGNSLSSAPGRRPQTPSASLAGNILWLPRVKDVRDVTIPSDCYKHPVVILSREPTSIGNVSVLIITSLGGRDLVQRFPQITHPSRCTHLPIYPSNPHPDLHICLTLAEGHEPLRKNSYINTETIRVVPLTILLPCYGGARRALSQDSLSVVIRHCSFADAPSSPPERADLRSLPQHMPSSSFATSSTNLLTLSQPITTSTNTRSVRLYASVAQPHPQLSREIGRQALLGVNMARYNEYGTFSAPGNHSVSAYQISGPRSAAWRSPILPTYQQTVTAVPVKSSTPGFWRLVSCTLGDFLCVGADVVGKASAAIWPYLKVALPIVLRVAIFVGMLYAIYCGIVGLALLIGRMAVDSVDWVKRGVVDAGTAVVTWIKNLLHLC